MAVNDGPSCKGQSLANFSFAWGMDVGLVAQVSRYDQGGVGNSLADVPLGLSQFGQFIVWWVEFGRST